MRNSFGEAASGSVLYLLEVAAPSPSRTSFSSALWRQFLQPVTIAHVEDQRNLDTMARPMHVPSGPEATIHQIAFAL